MTENHHIPDDLLLRVVRRLPHLVEQCAPGSVKGCSSLLGAGRQNLLRTSSGTTLRVLTACTVIHKLLYKFSSLKCRSNVALHVEHVGNDPDFQP